VSAGLHLHYDVEGAGHYGIFAGRRWREKVYPQVRDFIQRFEARSAATANVTPLKKARTR
jgi:poly(3-hydroxybutyrate) depolymerase